MKIREIFKYVEQYNKFAEDKGLKDKRIRIYFYRDELKGHLFRTYKEFNTFLKLNFDISFRIAFKRASGNLKILEDCIRYIYKFKWCRFEREVEVYVK